MLSRVVVALLIVLPAQALADEGTLTEPEQPAKKKTKRRSDERGSVSAGAEATTGVLTGEGTVRDTGGFVRVEASVRPRLDQDRWRFDLPVELVDRETVGAAFPERSGDAEARARWRRDRRLRATVEAGAAGTWRPNWPDPYQPLGGGMLAASSRRSHLDVHAGAGVDWVPMGDHRVALDYEVTRVDYADDDSFDPIDEPTHLVPADHLSHELDGSWTLDRDRWKAGVELGLRYRAYAKLYARDAGTGLTHAGAGGAPPNPLQRTLLFEPAAVFERALGRGELRLSYALPVQRDLFEGYYSYLEHHPEVDLELAAGRTTVEISADLRWRTYGAGSYAEDPPDHPMLDWGDRRSDRTVAAGAALRRPLTGALDLVGGAALRVRRTNFPDYTPGVFPASRTYDIDWDYDDVTIWAGVAWHTRDGGD